MSQKQQKPTLSGQRIKTRKRDEKEKYDPQTFRDQIIGGLNEAGSDIEQASKFLVAGGSKFNYRLYAETLLDVLIAGGMLAPGGAILDDGPKFDSNVCIFETNYDIASMRGIVDLFLRLIRQFKYLEKSLNEEIKKVLLFLKGFTEEQRGKLAMALSIFLAEGVVNPQCLVGIFGEHLVREGIALEFATKFFESYIAEKDSNSLISLIKKAEVDGKLLELFPVNKRSEGAFEAYFNDVGLSAIVDFQHSQYTRVVKKELQIRLKDLMQGEAKDGSNQENGRREMIAVCKEYKDKHALLEHEISLIVWKTIMNSVEWNKKEDLVADQALRHLRQHAGVLAAFATTGKSELVLIQKIQEYCYDNMNFMKVFQKIILLFYKMDVLGEDAIIKWYKDGHLSKGKTVFLQQMAKMVEWLQNAEEESSEEEEEG